MFDSSLNAKLIYAILPLYHLYRLSLDLLQLLTPNGILIYPESRTELYKFLTQFLRMGFWGSNLSGDDCRNAGFYIFTHGDSWDSWLSGNMETPRKHFSSAFGSCLELSCFFIGGLFPSKFFQCYGLFHRPKLLPLLWASGVVDLINEPNTVTGCLFSVTGSILGYFQTHRGIITADAAIRADIQRTYNATVTFTERSPRDSPQAYYTREIKRLSRGIYRNSHWTWKLFHS